MIASLAMYDWPTQSAHWDVLWTSIRDALRADGMDAPEALTRGGSLREHWRHPDLVLGQTCGMPFRQGLHRATHLVGTLDHGLPGARPGYYYSVMVTRADDVRDLPAFANRTLAYNGLDSESGWAAAQALAASHGFRFSRKLHTGTHGNSATAVATGETDIAAIDAETWRLIAENMPGIANALRVVAHTAPTPGLPLICARRFDPERIATALQSALTTTPAATLDALRITGFVRIPAAEYLAVPSPELPSQDAPAA